MSSHWSESTLADICAGDGTIQTGPFGSQLHAEDYREQGVPVVMPTNIGENRVIESGIARIDESDAERLKRHRLRTGDIVYSRRGDITRRALVRPNQSGWLCGTGCLLVRPNSDVDSVWLSYWLGTPFVHEWLQRHSVGATMANLNTGILAALPVSLPPLAEQRRIAGVLGALDDLIETNQRLASASAALRSTLVRKTLTACDEAVPLSSVARFVNGKNFTKEASGHGRPVIRTPEIRRGPDAGTVRSDVAVGPEFMAQPGDILFVWSGSLMVERWLYEEGLVNQHIFKVIPEPVCPAWLAFGLIEFQMPWFLGLAADKATTMGHIQRGHLDAPVPWPAEESIRHLGKVVDPLWDQELALRLEVQQLARTRDELLPLLLSGRVSVREVAA